MAIALHPLGGFAEKKKKIAKRVHESGIQKAVPLDTRAAFKAVKATVQSRK